MRLIDADAFDKVLKDAQLECKKNGGNFRYGVLATVRANLEKAPTVSGWVSMKDDMPKEHNSIFANHTHLSKYLWAKESDNVIVYVRFPDGTGRVTEGRLKDGKWWTRISPALEPTVTHWKPLPEPPEVDK